MDRQLLVWLCAATTDGADTFITWRSSRLIAHVDWVNVWFRSAWTDYARWASYARLSWWPTTIAPALSSGSAPVGRISPKRWRWELMSRSDFTTVILSGPKNPGSILNGAPMEINRDVSASSHDNPICAFEGQS